MASSYKAPKHGAVVDIGGSHMYGDIGARLIRILKAEYKSGDKATLPDELLYDDVGLPIWNEIIMTPEFYQTHDEIALFDNHGADIANRVNPGVSIIDLGAGDTRKVEHLLQAFETAKVPATYLALDISRASLEQNVRFLKEKHDRTDDIVRCAGIWGTFDHGMEYVQNITSQRLFLSLGSVLCNDPWPEALHHLKYWANTLQPNDLLLVGMDAHLSPKDRAKIWAAYHSRSDLYNQFFLNGFDHANRLVGDEWFREKDWEFLAELEEEPTTRHRFFFRAKRDIRLEKIDRTIKKGEELDWFDSHKYGEDSVRLMCYKAGLSVVDVWQAPGSEFRMSNLPSLSGLPVTNRHATGQYLLKTRGNRDQKEDADSAVSGLS